MEETSSLTNTIIETINSIFQALFSSIDKNVYQILDDLTFIHVDILEDSIFEKFFGVNISHGLLLIANSLLIAFVLYYAIKLLYSYYMNLQVETPYQFIFKVLILGIVMNTSYFICKEIIYLNSLVSDAIQSVGPQVLGCQISFSELVNQLNINTSSNDLEFNIFSFDGLIKSFVSISLFNLVFSYSLRYVILKVFILITPFAILSFINQSTSWFFKTWLRVISSLLLQQSFVAIILLIIFSFDLSANTLFAKLMYIGGMYSLIRANSYMRQLIGGISTDVSTNFNPNILKNIS